MGVMWSGESDGTRIHKRVGFVGFGVCVVQPERVASKTNFANVYALGITLLLLAFILQQTDVWYAEVFSSWIHSAGSKQVDREVSVYRARAHQYQYRTCWYSAQITKLLASKMFVPWRKFIFPDASTSCYQWVHILATVPHTLCIVTCALRRMFARA